MPDRRAHRGPHPADHQLFSDQAVLHLREATGDLCWLLNRGYASPSALKLVGDRYQLVQRQRVAVARCACSDAAREQRLRHQVRLGSISDERLLIDGYNVLTTIEAALAGGVLLVGRDGCCRDMASVHGTFRRVAETVPALQLLGNFLAFSGIQQCVWYLDSPVSNSGRLKGFLQAAARNAGWSWSIELVQNPDSILAQATEPVATADSVILDRCQRWVNLACETVHACVPQVHVIDL